MNSEFSTTSKARLTLCLLLLLLFLARFSVIGQFEFADQFCQRVFLTCWIGLLLPLVFYLWRRFRLKLRWLATVCLTVFLFVWIFICTMIWIFIPDPSEVVLLKHLSYGGTDFNLRGYPPPKSMYLEKKRLLLNGLLIQTKVLSIVKPVSNADITFEDGENKIKFVALHPDGRAIVRVYDTSWPVVDLSGTDHFGW